MKRPSSVPADAYWDSADKEWVAGKTTNGQKDGVFRYWRSDGTLCAETTWQHGSPTGPYRRFHENGEVSQEGNLDAGQLDGVIQWHRSDTQTTEHTIAPTCAPAVWSTKQRWAKGVLFFTHYFDRAGNEITEGGTAVPPRPHGVDPGAVYNDMAFEQPVGPGMWHYGAHVWALNALVPPKQRVGEWKYWSEDGRLLSRVQHARGRIATTEEYYENGGVHWRGVDVDDQDDESQALLWTEFSLDGSIRAEGVLANRPKGVWHFWSGADSDPIRVEAAAFNRYLVRRPQIHQLGSAVSRPLDPALLVHPALHGLDGIPWDALICAYPKFAKFIPHYLRGLASADEVVRSASLAAIELQFAEWGGYSAVAAAVPFLVALISEPLGAKPRPDREALLGILVAVVGQSLSRVRAKQLSLLQRAAGHAAEEEGGEWSYNLPSLRSEDHPGYTGPDYNNYWEGWGAIYESVGAGTSRWESIVRDAETSLTTRQRAAQLLAIGVGESDERFHRVQSLLKSAELPELVAAELLLGAVLLPKTDALLRLLAAPQSSALLQMCAAMTRVRIERDHSPSQAIDALLDVSRHPERYERYSDLGWSHLSLRDPDKRPAYADATTTLGLLGEGAALLPIDDRPHRYPYRLARRRLSDGSLQEAYFSFPWSGCGVVVQQDDEACRFFATNEDASNTHGGVVVCEANSPQALRLYERYFIVWSPKRRRAGLFYRDRFEAIIDFANDAATSRYGSDDWEHELEEGLHEPQPQ